MKEGWTYKKLGEVCEILNGFAFKSSEYVAEGIRVIRITNVQKGYVEDPAPKFYPYETQNELSRYLLKDGDLLLSLTGNVGRVAIIEKKYLPAYLNQRVACIRIKKGSNLDISFLFHLLYSKKFEEDCIKSANGAAQLNMSTVWLASYIIPVPSLSEQQAIVSRLDSAFAQIDALKANAEKQLEEARKLFQAELTESMKPKEGWEEKKLGEVCKSVNYGTSMPSSENGQFKYIRMNNITIDGTLNLDNLKTISVPDKELEKCLVKKGDLLFNRTNSPELVGKSCIFEEDEDMVIAGYIIRIRFNDAIYPPFANYFINLQRQLGNLRPLIVGAVHQANISAKAIQSINISFPNVETQQEIASRLDALSANVKRLEELQQKTLKECDALKQAMLREVFE